MSSSNYKLRFLALFLLSTSIAAAQGQQASLSNPLGGDIIAASANCSVVLSCVWQKLPVTATTTTITISGTFVATLPIETSADNGVTFTTSSTQSAAAVVTLTTTSLTDVRVRASAYTSGKASINIQTAGNQLNVTVTTSGGITPNNPIPASQAQGPTYNVLNYDPGTINDAQRISDGVTAGGAAKTVTSATASFVAGDVGKKITCISGAGALIMPIATIVARNSATSVTTDTNDNGAANTLRCIWYTKNAGPAIRAAILAATPTNSGSKDPNAGPTLGNSGTAYCPAGGYAVTVNAVVGALLTFAGSGASIGPNFVGEGKTKCNIYVLPDSTDPGGPTIINLFNSAHSVIGGFSVDGLGFNFPFTHAIVSMNAVQHSRMYDVEVTNISANTTNKGTLDFTNSSDIIVENAFVQGASGSGNNDFACGFSGTTSSHFKNLTCSNHNQTAFFGSGGGTLRGVAGDNAPVIEDATFDECGSATLDCTVFVAGYANFIGGWIGVGNTGRNAMNVDGTSRVWLSDVNCGQFGSTNVVTNCMTIASGGEVSATMSDLRGNGSGANGVAVTGPAGAKFNSIGGNRIRNCVSAVCTDITAATFATQGFTGGIVPKSSETHTPNTVVAVQGNLLATAQNLATFLNDQNYQILNITAQSGGTTPANSACATPPVITFSDGTRTATLTMTTAKTQWSSAVDASSVGAVFGSGTTLTISIGANTCATPPVNVSVSYVLQSVLNP